MLILLPPPAPGTSRKTLFEEPVRLSVALQRLDDLFPDKHDEIEAIGLMMLSLLSSVHSPPLQVQAWTHQLLYRVFAYLGQNERQLEHLFQAKAILDLLPEQKLTYDNYILLGRVCNSMGELPASVQYFQKCVSFYEKQRFEKDLCRSLLFLGESYLHLGEMEKVQQTQKQALAIARGLKERKGIYVGALFTNARVAIMLEQFEEAQKYLDEAETIPEVEIYPYEKAMILFTSGELCLAQKKYEDAKAVFGRFLEDVGTKDLGMLSVMTSMTHLFLGKIALEEEKLKEAEKRGRAALEVLGEAAFATKRLEVLKFLVVVAKKAKNIPEARQLLKEQIEVSRQLAENRRSQEQLQLQFREKRERLQAQWTAEHTRRLEEQSLFQRMLENKQECLELLVQDLRSPLSSIEHLVHELQERRENEDEDAAFYHEEMERQTGYILSLMQSLLEMSRLEARALHLEEVFLESFLEEIFQSLQIPAQLHGLSLNLSVELPATFQWLCDKTSITEALMNLLSNALKYSSEGSEVSLRAYLRNKELIFEVEDDGEGIPEQYQKLIFERFYRIPQHRDSIEGSGLGLSIVKLAVEHHRGEIQLESKEGQGSLFRLVFPLTMSEREIRF